MKINRFVPLCFFLFFLGLFPFFSAAQPYQNEAGYMSIEPISFYFHYGSYFNRLALTSSEARIWYSFQAADQNDADTPVFVFFNGGPGSATSSGLMSMCTSRFTLDNTIETGGGNAYIPNPTSWTQIGHLLYIDAREAGFSYNLMDQAPDESARFQEFNAQNYNSFFDAADYIRLLLRFLAAHPGLQNHPVVIVGESYGGIRSTAMLYILLNYAGFADGSEMYQDMALADEIQTHFDIVFPAYSGQVLPPELIALQFGHQVLIQPAITFEYQSEIQEEMWRQPGSPLYQIGDKVGIPYDPETYPDAFYYVRNICGRDVYTYTKPTNWLNNFFNNAGLLLRQVEQLSTITGVDVRNISGLYASARSQAYRLVTTDYYDVAFESKPEIPAMRELFEIPALLEAPYVRAEPGNLNTVFGSLQPWDCYYLGNNSFALYAFHYWNVAQERGYDIYFYEPRYGHMFLKNVAFVHTFITHAALDLVCYSKALPPSLGRHTDIVSSVEHVTTGTEDRPGKIELHYQPSAFPDVPGLTARTIRFPLYATSCHAVPLTQPADFLNDVCSWLQNHGIDVQVLGGNK
ncbi:MAG: hypothetical protein JXB26_11690 [Candidatus Aminicenantes bacterium]|nr:hypothetical protein [Candidatus Aminicenantes bacterium]